jgi:hypothetical protein
MSPHPRPIYPARTGLDLDMLVQGVKSSGIVKVRNAQ